MLRPLRRPMFTRELAAQKEGAAQRIMHRTSATFVFHVNFPKPVIRRER